MSSSKPSRRLFTNEQKAAILREHLADRIPVSDVCDKHSLQPSVFYQWQKQALDHLVGALATPAGTTGPSKREKALVVENTQLKAKLTKKDSVIAEIAAEYTQLKKELGEP